jgi:hypothetical protein
LKISKSPFNLNLPEKSQISLAQSVRGEGKIAENKLLAQGAAYDINKEQDLLNRINREDSLSNRLISKYLLALDLKLTAASFTQAENALHALTKQTMTSRLDNTAVLAAILAVKLGLSESQEALLAIFNRLNEGSKFINILERMTIDFKNLRLANDPGIEKVFKYFEYLKQQLNLDINTVQLNKLVNFVLRTPEKLLAGHSGKEVIANYSLIWQLDQLIVMMQDAGMEKELRSLIKESILLKQILVGNILLHHEETLGNQIFIPFYFCHQPSHIKISANKSQKKRNNGQLQIEIKIEHKRFGNIRFMLTMIDRNISAEIFLLCEEAKQIIEANISLLVQKLSDLGYNCKILHIGLVNEEEQIYCHDLANIMQLIEFSLLDIKV